MSAAAILERLRREGLRVRTDGERVLLSPPEKVTPDVLELVRAHKPALLEALAEVPDLERRRAKVLADLTADPGRRIAVDVAGAPLRRGPGEPVSVMLAVRCRDGRIVCAELTIPRARFDAALFLATLTETARHPV